MRNLYASHTNNGLRLNQAYVAANDIKQIFIQKNNNVDTNILTYYKGNIGIGTTTPSATSKLDIVGNTQISTTLTANIINTSGLITGNSGITVPSGQTLTSGGTLTANIINSSGLITGNTGITIPINKTLTSNGHISVNTLTTSGLITANTLTASGLITGNGGIQVSTIKIGVGGLLKMATSTVDFTQIGTTNSLLGVSTCINLCGYTHATYPSSILYNWEQTGKHIFFTTNAGFTNEKMRIENNGEIISTGNKIGLLGASPTLYLRHSNTSLRSVMIHYNSNTLYFLSGPYSATTTSDNWNYDANSMCPLTINLTNNEVVFGGNVNVQSLNNIGVSDFLRASHNVFFSKVDYYRYETATAYSVILILNLL